MAIVVHEDIEKELLILSHEAYLKEISQRLPGLQPQELFNINTPFRMDEEARALVERMVAEDTTQSINQKKNKKKRKHSSISQSDPEDMEEISYIKRQFDSFSKMLATHSDVAKHFLPGKPKPDIVKENNIELRRTVANLMDRIGAVFDASSCQKEENNSAEYVIKHVKRKRKSCVGYEMLTNEELGQIPIKSLLADNGVVAVWCSNNKRHKDAIRSWFKDWELTEVGCWYWVKLTRHGELVTLLPDFLHANQGKRPYELLIIGQKGSTSSTQTQDSNRIRPIPDQLALFSIPSGIHSHKPPIHHFLTKLLASSSLNPPRRMLEIFGRYLVEGWTTIGLEPFKLSLQSMFLPLDEEQRLS